MTSQRNDIIADFLERAGWTAGQQFFAVLLATGTASSVVDLPWQNAGIMAIGAALVSILTTGIQYLAKLTNLGFWPDLIVRMAKTFLASVLGSIGADAFDVFAFDWAAALDLAVITTLGALAKGLLARGSGTASESGVAVDTKAAATRSMVNPSTLPSATYVRAVTAMSAARSG